MSVVLILLVAAGAYGAVCAVRGFGPAGTLADFEPADGLPTRRFREDAATVAQAYERAVASVPGMRLADRGPGTLLVDLRPTSRILAGNFGQVLRIELDAAPSGTSVRVTSRNKVGRALLGNGHGSLVEAERRLRMSAKRHGLDELVVTAA